MKCASSKTFLYVICEEVEKIVLAVEMCYGNFSFVMPIYGVEVTEQKKIQQQQ